MGIKMFFARKVVAFISFFEVICFLLKNKSIFKNRVIYISWFDCFGHTISGIDFASRIFYPHRISVIYMDHPHANAYIPLLFQHNVDPYIFRGVSSIDNWSLGNIGFKVMLFVLEMLSVLNNNNKGDYYSFRIVTYPLITRMLSLSDQKLYLGEWSNEREEAQDFTCFTRILKEGIGKNASLPQELDDLCHTEIQKVFPTFFDKPFVTILLRKKGSEGKFSDSSRCAGPHQNYRDAVKLLINEGYHVAGIMETEHEAFSDIEGYFPMSIIEQKSSKLDKKLLSVFFLIKCSLFIGQQSGPYSLPVHSGIPCLICDASSYRGTTYDPHNLSIFKHYVVEETGKRLSDVEIYTKHQDLAFGYNFTEKGIRVEPCTPEEIVEGVKETLARMRGKLRLSKEDELLCKKYYELPPKNMNSYYQRNRPPLAALRRMKDELLGMENFEINKQCLKS